ncbi:MAG: divalent-cation tolerance protein CutA [Magnetococcales bacterium]|nr:divalent-cation tolerance protein CutA [Magnetococcales bacterium]
MDTELVLVWTTVPDEALAASVAESLLREQLAACVHVLPGGRSFYHWQGALHRDAEWTLLIKTRQALYPVLEQRLLALHPYEVPEILQTPITRCLPAYGAWLLASTPLPAVAQE